MSDRDAYDVIGQGYAQVRRPDPRLERAIWRALGDAQTVLNVGAGAGSYEPTDREVTAVEPSAVMVAQRPAGAAPVVDARAEELPFASSSFDAVMAVLSDHHWSDRARGLCELRRVARRRVVLFTWDRSFADAFWLTRDYLPGFKRLPGMPIDAIMQCIGGTRSEPVPIPHDCRDGFYHAFWRRPAAYLDVRVRVGISAFARLEEVEVASMVRGLSDDLQTGAWARRNAELLELRQMDFGYRVLVAEL